MLQERLLGAGSKVASSRSEVSVGTSSAGAGAGAGSQDSKSFLETLKGALETTNDLQKGADKAANNFAAGKGSLHETMIAMEKADLALRTITQVRGKLIEAYQEVSRMPV
ncbi:flagellar hook-basal body complex protein FliE [bacterium]|nr:flagellar hook-basal body complex protein FliE [bacterium]